MKTLRVLIMSVARASSLSEVSTAPIALENYQTHLRRCVLNYIFSRVLSTFRWLRMSCSILREVDQFAPTSPSKCTQSHPVATGVPVLQT